ncbi:MAG: hypothetical protein IT167_07325 [Bryobacterales bacterium]|nr:hypothetical protein [Bryobacterales bacterium]
MFRRLFIAAAALLCLSACTPEPEWYAPPMQRAAPQNAEPRAVGSVIAMDSPLADSHIVSGVLRGEPLSQWRWTNQRPELRFFLTETKGLKFFMDFVLAEATFKFTGPVTVRFSIDGKALGSAHYSKPGDQHYETEVPESLLKTSEPVTVAAEVDKVYVSPQDGVKLGFLLVRAGFEQ